MTVEIVALVIAAIIMTEIYCRTERPKLYAFLNTAAGTACVFLLSGNINSFGAALAAVFGVPGALLRYMLGMI